MRKCDDKYLSLFVTLINKKFSKLLNKLSLKRVCYRISSVIDEFRELMINKLYVCLNSTYFNLILSILVIYPMIEIIKNSIEQRCSVILNGQIKPLYILPLEFQRN